MDALVLSYGDVKQLIDIIGKDSIMRDCIARLRQGLVETATGHRQACPPRAGFVIGDEMGHGVIEYMPYYQDREGMTLKTISYKPLNNSSNGLPTVVGVLCRYSDETGSWSRSAMRRYRPRFVPARLLLSRVLFSRGQRRARLVLWGRDSSRLLSCTV
jgi:ornithine cyclodeaminase/alanine dehydrogenase-like protein (mu-crystallin family)